MKNNSFKKTIIFLAFCAITGAAKSQENNVVNLLPPAPNAASLGKYVGANTGLSSGSANFSISLVNYSSKHISLPISINYATSGFKVDEIASRVGNQWALNAGGVITRTVFGSVDEKSTRIRPIPELGDNNDFPLFSFESALANPDPLQGVGPSGSIDAQPDMFSFNFDNFSGRFILDTLGPNRKLVPVMLSNMALKVEITQGGNQAPITGFKITAPDGKQYFFGEDATEYTQNTGSCGAAYANNSTAWYLKRIVHPNGDVVTFYYSALSYDYQLGRSETIYVFTGSNPTVYCGGTVSRPQPTNNSCINALHTTGVVLDSIASTFGDKIVFSYTGRQDDNDKLVSSISVYSPDYTTLFKTFDFQYQYAGSRPFLMSLSEKNGIGALLHQHKFQYNDLSSIPAALSYAQDYWGFFNGQFSNTTGIPKPKDPDFAQALPLATANRDPDPLYASKGLLNLITYPTGGKDSIVYEGNQAYQMTTIYPVEQTLKHTADNPTGNSAEIVTVSTGTAEIAYQQQVNISATCSTTASLPSSTRYTSLEIRDASGNMVTNFLVNPGSSLNNNFILNPGTYRIAIHLFGDHISTKATLTYRAGTVSNQMLNRAIGGVRVAKILTYDGISTTPTIKKYYYNKFLNPDQSSASTINLPPYERNINMYLPCPGYGSCSPSVEFPFKTSSSSAPLTLSKTPTPATYKEVTEGFGENFENGGIEHTFTVSPNRDAAIFRGTAIVGAPTGDEIYRNGKETYQGTFKIQAGQRQYVHKTFTHYVEDTSFAGQYTGYIATEKIRLYCGQTTDNTQLSWERSNYNTSYYFIHKAWMYVDTVKDQSFDTNGLLLSESLTNYQYNIISAQPSSITTYNSTGNTLKTVLSYPSDFSTTAPYNAMISNNIVAPVIVKAEFNNSNPMVSTRTNYKNWMNTIFAPETVETQTRNNPYEIRLRYYAYDDQGNVLSTSKENGPKTNYIWGYNGVYPIAKIDNADYSVVQTALGGNTAVTSFRNIRNPSDAQVNSFLATLRTNTALKNAFVISNLFDLVNGLKSTVDPKGMPTYYEYDNFQRLQNIKDKDGNIIKHYDYHYQGQ
ncbi:RHS repeat domain-containing protein [Mucilaginibacter kameinonensis]|uniref:hypothetical protein n=1 Tax=Mucilaginibacter kameinonensis TaxID=452286 RepID=UPI000EF77E00|nr:hypothetical protein [Mucilaginibacter kameinonensis]